MASISSFMKSDARNIVLTIAGEGTISRLRRSSRTPSNPWAREAIRCSPINPEAPLTECIVRKTELDTNSVQLFGDDGLTESAIIGAKNEDEGMPAGKMTWPHGFHVRRWKFQPGYSTLRHSRDEEEVILVQSGRLKYVCADGELEMQAGYVLTAPVAEVRQYVSGEDEAAIAYVVRGGDSPGQVLPAANAN